MSEPLSAAALLLHVQQRALAVPSALALQFFAVHELHPLIPHRQAALWRNGRVVTLSGVPSPDGNAPFVQWLEGLFTHLSQGPQDIRPCTPQQVPGDLHEGWREWLPGQLLLLPLVAPGGEALGMLLLAREEPFHPGEVAACGQLAPLLAAIWKSLLPPPSFFSRWWWREKWRGRGVIWLVLFLLAMGLPVRLSVLAPARVVPENPVVVRAPLSGVVERFLVQPNQVVAPGEPLLRMDDTALHNQLRVARKKWDIAQAEYAQAAQGALHGVRDKTRLAILKGEREIREQEVRYTESLLERVVVRAPQGGMAVFSDPNDWLGRPVSLGERLLFIADHRHTEMEIALPLADAITLAPGAEVALFLNAEPGFTYHGQVRQVSHEAEPTPEGILAHRLKASFTGTADRRPALGLRGTARIYHGDTTLGYLLFRRPLSALRQYLGA